MAANATGTTMTAVTDSMIARRAIRAGDDLRRAERRGRAGLSIAT